MVETLGTGQPLYLRSPPISRNFYPKSYAPSLTTLLVLTFEQRPNFILPRLFPNLYDNPRLDPTKSNEM